MGSIIQANCKCGFESDEIYAGGGMRNFANTLDAPAICKECNTFQIRNYFSEHTCENCGKEIIYYNNKSLMIKEAQDNAGSVFEWWMGPGRRNPDGSDEFRIPACRCFCPECEEYSLIFRRAGLWD